MASRVLGQGLSQSSVARCTALLQPHAVHEPEGHRPPRCHDSLSQLCHSMTSLQLTAPLPAPAAPSISCSKLRQRLVSHSRACKRWSRLFWSQDRQCTLVRDILQLVWVRPPESRLVPDAPAGRSWLPCGLARLRKLHQHQQPPQACPENPLHHGTCRTQLGICWAAGFKSKLYGLSRGAVNETGMLLAARHAWRCIHPGCRWHGVKSTLQLRQHAGILSGVAVDMGGTARLSGRSRGSAELCRLTACRQTPRALRRAQDRFDPGCHRA